jgi:hypothetical protein
MDDLRNELLEHLGALEREAHELRLELEKEGDADLSELRRMREHALLRAARLTYHYMGVASGPIAIGPGGGTGGSAVTPVSTKCPHCGHQLTLS